MLQASSPCNRRGGDLGDDLDPDVPDRGHFPRRKAPTTDAPDAVVSATLTLTATLIANLNATCVSTLMEDETLT